VAQVEEEPPQEDAEETDAIPITRNTPVSYLAAMVPALEAKLNLNLVKQSRVAFENPQTGRRFLLLSSRLHPLPNGRKFWFALHAHQWEYLGTGSDNAIVLACGSANEVILVPKAILDPLVSNLSHRITENRDYWHLVIVNSAPDDWKLILLSGAAPLDLSPYLIQ
jgi:hypothetical protein